MYSDVFCRVYNEFGWNYYPEAFAGELLAWLEREGIVPKSCLDLGCGTGILCGALARAGMRTLGVDLSEGMVAMARENYPELAFAQGNMVTFRREGAFDLVTCTGDALNHIAAISDVERIFANVHASLTEGGWFVFDILNEKEVSDSEPFEMDFSDSVRVWFQMTRPTEKSVNLCVRVWENGRKTLEENIRETLHDPAEVCAMLEKQGFRVALCADSLTGGGHGTTWFVAAQR